MARLAHVLAIVVGLYFGVSTPTWAQDADPWKLLERLVGDGRGTATGHAGMFSFDTQRKVLMLRQLHTEGFVTTYEQASESGAAKLVCASEGFENFSNAWKARGIYDFDGEDRFVETFELAPPGKDFQVCSRTEFRRAK